MDAELKDIKGLEEVSLGYPPALWALLVLCIVGIAALFWWIKRRRPAAKTGPMLSPYDIAQREFMELGQCDGFDELEVRRYFYGLSDILRRYIEAQFKLAATDQTSEEFIAALPSVGTLQNSQLDALQKFVHATDLVKYAKGRPSSSEIETSLLAAQNFVRTSYFKSIKQGAQS